MLRCCLHWSTRYVSRIARAIAVPRIKNTPSHPGERGVATDVLGRDIPRAQTLRVAVLVFVNCPYGHGVATRIAEGAHDRMLMARVVWGITVTSNPYFFEQRHACLIAVLQKKVKTCAKKSTDAEILRRKKNLCIREIKNYDKK